MKLFARTRHAAKRIADAMTDFILSFGIAVVDSIETREMESLRMRFSRWNDVQSEEVAEYGVGLLYLTLG
jgi:hypothetical protein